MRITWVVLVTLLLGACTAAPRQQTTPEASSAPAPAEPASEPMPVEAAPDPEPRITQPPTQVEPVSKPIPEPQPVAAPQPEVAITPRLDPVAATAQPLTASLAGRIDLIQVHEVSAGPALLSRTWVAFRPRTPVDVQPAEELRILTRQSQFQPQAMAVTLGTTVRFPNLDRILHNVFSLTPGQSFDVGLYGPGAGEAHTFNRAGFVDIFCNVHSNMAAFLWVLDTPHFAQVNSDGSFRIDNVPAVGGALDVWNHRADLVSIPAVAPDENLRATLRITRPPVPQHTNKLGEAY